MHWSNKKEIKKERWYILRPNTLGKKPLGKQDKSGDKQDYDEKDLEYIN